MEVKEIHRGRLEGEYSPICPNRAAGKHSVDSGVGSDVIDHHSERECFIGQFVFLSFVGRPAKNSASDPTNQRIPRAGPLDNG
jgi:hypothetical protein